METVNTTIWSHDVTVTRNNIHITKSYNARNKKTMNNILSILLEYLEDNYPTMITPLDYRSRKSLIREWTAHNNLYRLGLYKDRTRDVDLNYPLKWYHKVGYFILGLITI